MAISAVSESPTALFYWIRRRLCYTPAPVLDCAHGQQKEKQEEKQEEAESETEENRQQESDAGKEAGAQASRSQEASESLCRQKDHYKERLEKNNQRAEHEGCC